MGLMAKMICVDDDSLIRQVVKMYMQEAFHVVLACSAEEGLDMMESHGPFHVVLSDYGMPGMNGVAFLSQVAERWPETIRILMSGGGADLEMVKRAIRAGHISRFLTKPFCIISLRNQLLDECNARGVPDR